MGSQDLLQCSGTQGPQGIWSPPSQYPVHTPRPSPASVLECPIIAHYESQGCPHHPIPPLAFLPFSSPWALAALTALARFSSCMYWLPRRRPRRSLRLLFPFSPLLSIVITHRQSTSKPSLNSPSYSLFPLLFFLPLPASSYVLTTVTPWTLIALLASSRVPVQSFRAIPFTFFRLTRIPPLT